MKKLLAIFAILAAFSSTAFAEMTDSDQQTATVTVWTPISVVVTVADYDANILTTESSTVDFSAVVTGEFVDGFYTAGWSFSDETNWDITEGGTLNAPTATCVLGPGKAAGTYSITATYTASYTF